MLYSSMGSDLSLTSIVASWDQERVSLKKQILLDAQRASVAFDWFLVLEAGSKNFLLSGIDRLDINNWRKWYGKL